MKLNSEYSGMTTNYIKFLCKWYIYFILGQTKIGRYLKKELVVGRFSIVLRFLPEY